VARAPQEFPDDYVVYWRGQGAHCPSGTWLYPQEPRMPALRLAITALDPVITLHGTFPLPHPYTGVVQFFSRSTLVAARPILSWSAHTVSVRVPPRLIAGTYSVLVSWYDRLTGATVRTRFPCYVQRNAPVAPTPVPVPPTNTPTSPPTVPNTPPAASTATLPPPTDTLGPTNTPPSTPAPPTHTAMPTATPTNGVTPTGTPTPRATPTANPA